MCLNEYWTDRKVCGKVWVCYSKVDCLPRQLHGQWMRTLYVWMNIDEEMEMI